jgi:hypothetical protein
VPRAAAARSSGPAPAPPAGTCSGSSTPTPRPAPGAGAHLTAALRRPDVVGGYLRVCFDGPTRAARLLTRLNPALNRFGLCYGDAALFVRRCDYEAVGGFRPFPLFEDLDLVSRLRRRGRLVCLPCAVEVSSRRFEGRNVVLVFAGWAGLQGLYWFGVPPALLARPYRPIRGRAAGRHGSCQV